MNWNEIREYFTATELNKLGFAYWTKEIDADGKILMLIPGKYYSKLTDGLELECIDGKKVVYNSAAKYPDAGYVDNDTRGGMLAYGIRVKAGV